jgi:hypothetical protein
LSTWTCSPMARAAVAVSLTVDSGVNRRTGWRAANAFELAQASRRHSTGDTRLLIA